jgi:hypothetical protein
VVESIPYPRRTLTLPVVLSGGEVRKVLDSIAAKRHRTICALMYVRAWQLAPEPPYSIRQASSKLSRGERGRSFDVSP